MEEPGSRGFAMEGAEPQLRRIITRSSSSQSLLDSAPYSYCVVASATGKKDGNATPGKAQMVAYNPDEEVMTVGRDRVVAFTGHEKPFLAAAVADGCGEHVKSSAWSYVDRLFSRKDDSEGGKKHDKEGQREKKKKRSSWLPEPERRWPIHGFY